MVGLSIKIDAGSSTPICRLVVDMMAILVSESEPISENKVEGFILPVPNPVSEVTAASKMSATSDSSSSGDEERDEETLAADSFVSAAACVLDSGGVLFSGFNI